MEAKNLLSRAPPYDVERAIVRLGRNLRTARLRRALTIEQAAERIGTGVRAVRDAEQGKPGTGVAVYAALLWAYGLLEPMGELADPLTDREGLALEGPTRRRRARAGQGLDNDF